MADLAHGDKGAEPSFRSLHPAAPKIWRLVGLPIAVAAGGAIFALALAVRSATDDPIASLALIATGLVALVGVAAAVWYPGHRYRHWHYRIGPDALEMRRGVWFRSESAVPFHRIQQIDVEQGPLQRRHGVVTLRLRTASASSQGALPQLGADEAELLRERLIVAARDRRTDDGH